MAFATVATIESQARIDYKAPTWDVDLSEAELFSCGGGSCANGWWPPDALAYAAGNGIGDEGTMPYADHDQVCNIPADKPDRMLKIGEWQEVVDVEQRKGWLDSNGPMVGCMAVYDDFFSYSDGIYEHAVGDLVGYHAVCCVGFNDTERYWVFKNSWGKDWGKDGFFKIAYGQAEIESSFAMYGVAGVTGTLEPPDDHHEDEGTATADYVVLQSDVGSDVLFAHVKGKWRYLPVTGARVAELGITAFSAGQVAVTYKGDRITALSSWKKF